MNFATRFLLPSMAITLLLATSPSEARILVVEPAMGTLPRLMVEVPGIETWPQAQIAAYAALYAFNSWGMAFWESDDPYWNSVGSPEFRQAGVGSFEGGLEYELVELWAPDSDVLGYSLNEESLEYGPARALHFHTDDTLTPSYQHQHDICEPLGFGMISGRAGGQWSQCMVPIWGIFYVEGGVEVESRSWGAVKALMSPGSEPSN